MKPTVGLPVEAEITTCAFQPDLDKKFCTAQATIHLCVRDPAWGVVSLLACADHDAIARATGEVLAEHPVGDACGFLTGECWP